MELNSQKADPVRLFWRRVLLLIVLVLVIFGLSGVWRIYKRERESAALNSESAARLADLTWPEAKLRADIAQLGTDRGKEAALREQYRMGKPGEKLIVIVNPPTPIAVPAISTPIIEWFKNIFLW